VLGCTDPGLALISSIITHFGLLLLLMLLVVAARTAGDRNPRHGRIDTRTDDHRGVIKGVRVSADDVSLREMLEMAVRTYQTTIERTTTSLMELDRVGERRGDCRLYYDVDIDWYPRDFYIGHYYLTVL